MQEVDKYRIGTVGRVNRDQLRIMSHGGYKGNAEQEHQITLAQNALVETYLGSGMDVIVDDTNMRGLKALGRWLEVADRFRVDLLVVDFLDIPIEECIRRNDLRLVGRVPVEAIHRTWNEFRKSFPSDPGREDHEVIAEFRTSVQSVERMSRYTRVELMVMPQDD
jgi:predicted kinase